MRNVTLSKVSLLALSSLLAACGGSSGGGSSSAVTESTIEAQFIDSPVKGLNYITGTAKGLTGDAGKFNCVTGEPVTFKIRDFTVGQGPCGSKIFLDDVAPAATADRIAAVIQSLSKAGGAAGTIDLSAIPETHTGLSSIDLSSDGALATALAAAKTALGSSNFVNTVTPTQARAHVNAQLEANAPSGDFLKNIQDIETLEGVKIVATRVSGDAEFCTPKYSAKFMTKDLDTHFVATLDDVVASEDGREVCSDADEKEDICSNEDGIIGEVRKIITSPVVTMGTIATYKFNHSVVEIEGQNVGIAHGTTNVNGKDFTEYWPFDVNNELVSVNNINNNFPFEAETKLAIKIDLTNYPASLTGSLSESNFDFYVSNYVNADSYTLNKRTQECRYTISKR